MLPVCFLKVPAPRNIVAAKTGRHCKQSIKKNEEKFSNLALLVEAIHQAWVTRAASREITPSRSWRAFSFVHFHAVAVSTFVLYSISFYRDHPNDLKRTKPRSLDEVELRLHKRTTKQKVCLLPHFSQPCCSCSIILASLNLSL